MGFFGAAHGWGAAKRLPSLKSVTSMMHLAQLYLTYGRCENYMNHKTYSLRFADISIFSPEISRFCYIKKYRYRLHFDTYFLILLTFLFFLVNMVTILMMPAKMTNPDLFKIKEFWNKGYDVIICVHGVTKKTLSRNSSYIIDVVMWPKFGNSSISMKEVIITLIL